jgi:hypothetical protein
MMEEDGWIWRSRRWDRGDGDGVVDKAGGRVCQPAVWGWRGVSPRRSASRDTCQTTLCPAKRTGLSVSAAPSSSVFIVRSPESVSGGIVWLVEESGRVLGDQISRFPHFRPLAPSRRHRLPILSVYSSILHQLLNLSLCRIRIC